MAKRNRDANPSRSPNESGERDMQDANPGSERQQGDGFRGTGKRSSGHDRDSESSDRQSRERGKKGDEPQRREGMRSSEPGSPAREGKGVGDESGTGRNKGERDLH